MFSAVFLPYVYYHVALTFSSINILQQDIHVNGIQTGLSYIPTIWLIFPLSHYSNKRSKKSALSLAISAGVVILIQCFLYIFLTGDHGFFSPVETNVRPVYGFWAITFGAVALLIGAIMAYRGDPSKKKRTNSDVLDDQL